MASISILLAYVYALKLEIALLAISFFAWTEWKSYQRLSQFKGPALARFSNLFMFNVIGRKRMNLELHEVSQTYGMFSYSIIPTLDLYKQVARFFY